MKKPLLCAVALGALAVYGSAAAQDSTAVVTTTTTISPYCSSLASLPTPAPLALGELAGPTGFLVADFAGETSRQVATGFYCNAPSLVTVRAEPLVHMTVATVADSSSFTNSVDYTATLTWDNFTDSVSSSVVDGVDIDVTEANVGDLIVTVEDPATSGNRRPISGDYEGAVHLTIALN